MPYIDSRDVQDRLDRAVGTENWSDNYYILGDVLYCSIAINVGGHWVAKSDCGYVGDSSSKKGGEIKAKGDASDAFKRAAVKWGIGRYLYSIDQIWVDYDPTHKTVIREGKPIPYYELDNYASELYHNIIVGQKADIIKDILAVYPNAKTKLADLTGNVTDELGIDLSAQPMLYWTYREEVLRIAKKMLKPPSKKKPS